MFFTFLGICLFLVLFAGMVSGLTIGLMALDPMELRILENEGNPTDQARAKKVLSLVSQHHLLLVTLLLGNSLAMEALPIFLDRLVPSWLAVLLSVTAILIFGEVLPQALCTGKHGLAIAATLAPIVWVLIFLFYLVAKPIAKILDVMLGHPEDEYYARSHLKALIRLHQQERVVQEGGVNDDALYRDEVVVIEGALDLAQKQVKQIMVPFDQVFMIEWNTRLTRKVLLELLETGHSRVPVYEGSRHNIRGILLVKQLIMVDPDDGVPVNEYATGIPLIAHPSASVYEVLNEFQVGRSHISLVTEDVEEYSEAMRDRRQVRPDARIVGIMTLEDVIEELIQEEIYDEFDDSKKGQVGIPLNNLRSVASGSALRPAGSQHGMGLGAFTNPRSLRSMGRSHTNPRITSGAGSQIGGTTVSLAQALASRSPKLLSGKLASIRSLRNDHHGLGLSSPRTATQPRSGRYDRGGDSQWNSNTASLSPSPAANGGALPHRLMGLGSGSQIGATTGLSPAAHAVSRVLTNRDGSGSASSAANNTSRGDIEAASGSPFMGPVSGGPITGGLVGIGGRPPKINPVSGQGLRGRSNSGGLNFSSGPQSAGGIENPLTSPNAAGANVPLLGSSSGPVAPPANSLQLEKRPSFFRSGSGMVVDPSKAPAGTPASAGQSAGLGQSGWAKEEGKDGRLVKKESAKQTAARHASMDGTDKRRPSLTGTPTGTGTQQVNAQQMNLPPQVLQQLQGAFHPSNTADFGSVRDSREFPLDKKQGGDKTSVGESAGSLNNSTITGSGSLLANPLGLSAMGDAAVSVMNIPGGGSSPSGKGVGKPPKAGRKQSEM